MKWDLEDHNKYFKDEDEDDKFDKNSLKISIFL